MPAISGTAARTRFDRTEDGAITAFIGSRIWEEIQVRFTMEVWANLLRDLAPLRRVDRAQHPHRPVLGVSDPVIEDDIATQGVLGLLGDFLVGRTILHGEGPFH